MYDEISAATDPLGADNPLIFMTGPLDATGAPSAGRFTVSARSPQSGLYGQANAGNFFGPELKFAGYDGIILRGKSPMPVYLAISPEKIELRDAARLRGMTTYATGDAVRAELRDDRAIVAAIGPAGENLVRYALILASGAGKHQKKGIAGRCGMGAVMGSKNLKAIAVRGDKQKNPVYLHDAARFNAAMLAAQKYLSHDLSTEMYRAVGTSGTIDYLGLLGDVPTKYWTQGTFDYGKISGNVLAETILSGRSTCHACMVACGRKVERAAGHALPHAEGPEYETLAAFGSLILNDDLHAATYIGSQCDALGIDSISAGATIAFATYLRELDLLPRQDLDGTDLRWGDPQIALKLVREIAARQNFGAVLAEGTQALGARYGVEGLAVQINGMEVPLHDPRANSGMAVAYATSPIGASHNQSDFFIVETGRPMEDLGIPALDRFECAGKAALVARHQDWRAFNNALVLCYFPNPPVQEICEMLSAATGYDIHLGNVLSYGERTWNLQRALNLKLGYDARRAEKLPELMLRALREGGTDRHVPDFDLMLREYYAARDWDWASGKPSRAKFIALGMEEIARDVEGA
ncbi:MAG: aldehyde ferredoxin oxidoreductase family protein [Chloroflexi bacterium]|nr:aldehyde ferredoxin oxidoreductase family protein [Chloroflexota bacterium]